MAILSSQALTWADLITKLGPDGTIGTVAEVLNQHNVIMRDGAFITANKGTEHETLVRVGLPETAWMKVGGYVKPTKSQTRAQKFTTGFCRSLSQVPQDILDLADDEAALRLSEAAPHLEGIAQEFEFMFFNGNTKLNPLGFDGMGAYYNALPTGNNNASNQVVNAGGVGSDNTSIWLIRHGEQQTSLIVPKNIQMGIQREDKGQQRDTDDNGGVRYVQEEMFTLHSGVAIKDYRANSRIANIDISDAKANTVDIMEHMVTAYHRARMPKHNQEVENSAFLGARACWYMNADLFEVLDKQARNKDLNPALQLGIKDIQGEETTVFRGLPIRVSDGITSTEAPLV
ncbi:major capsid protein [Sphingobium sp. HT1-2]|uniref:major capsid protein n=1 Tax=Sphingobium sp. HT1-2 TaxID=3111640 RepID=UPI003C073C47